MLLKIFENTFSGGDSRLKYQISKEERVFVAEKVFERKTYITAQAVFRKQFNQATPYKKENPTKL